MDIQIPNEPNITMNDVGGSALDFAKGLDAKESNAFNAYKMAAASYDKPLDVYSKLMDSQGVNQLMKTSTTLQGQVNDMEDSIRRAEDNVNATTRNSLVTEGQRQGLIEARRQPLQEDLSYLSTGLGRVQNAIGQAKSDIGTQVGLYMQGREQDMDVYKTEMSMIADQSARAMTGFTADRQTELDLLMDKLNRQRQLTDQETQRAFELAKMEKEYSMRKDEFSYQSEASQPTEIVTVGGRKKLINKQTGQVISDLGSSSDGGGSSGSYSSAKSYLPSKSSSNISSLWGF